MNFLQPPSPTYPGVYSRLVDSDGLVELEDLSAAEVREVVGKLAQQRYLKAVRAFCAKARTRRDDRDGKRRSYRIMVLLQQPEKVPEGQFRKTPGEKLKVPKQAEGGSLSAREVATRLGVSIVTVHDWRKRHRLLAWADVCRRYRFPVWQFDGPELLKGVSDCLVELREANLDDNDLLRFFVGRELNHDSSVLGLLQKGLVVAALARATDLKNERLQEMCTRELPF